MRDRSSSIYQSLTLATNRHFKHIPRPATFDKECHPKGGDQDAKKGCFSGSFYFAAKKIGLGEGAKCVAELGCTEHTKHSEIPMTC